MSTECTWGGGGWSVHESCLQAGQVPAGHTEGPKAPGAAGRGKGPVSSSGAPAGAPPVSERRAGSPWACACLTPGAGTQGRAGGGWGETTSLPLAGA